jgi:hypothetical protein
MYTISFGLKRLNRSLCRGAIARLRVWQVGSQCWLEIRSLCLLDYLVVDSDFGFSGNRRILCEIMSRSRFIEVSSMHGNTHIMKIYMRNLLYTDHMAQLPTLWRLENLCKPMK